MRHKTFESERLGPYFEYNTRHGAKGLFRHLCRKEALMNAIYTDGEICVTSFASPMFGEAYRGEWACAEAGGRAIRGAAILFVGTPSYVFSTDCWSVRREDGTRYATDHKAASPHDEAWLVPAKAKALAVYLPKGGLSSGDEDTLKRAKILIYRSWELFEAQAHLPVAENPIGDRFPGLEEKLLQRLHK